MLVIVFLIPVSCGSKSSSANTSLGGASIDGTYVYVDGISRSSVTISGDTWQMKTQFGAPGYYGSDAKYDSGKVKGNDLYHSGLFKYGEVSGAPLPSPAAPTVSNNRPLAPSAPESRLLRRQALCAFFFRDVNGSCRSFLSRKEKRENRAKTLRDRNETSTRFTSRRN